MHVGRPFTEQVAESYRRGVDERVRLTLVGGRERVGLGRLGRKPRKVTEGAAVPLATNSRPWEE